MGIIMASRSSLMFQRNILPAISGSKNKPSLASNDGSSMSYKISLNIYLPEHYHKKRSTTLTEIRFMK
jgi:hypothetical protein